MSLLGKGRMAGALVMSRLSRVNPRESVFGAGPELYRREIQTICPPNLAECVMALEDCCEEARVLFL